MSHKVKILMIALQHSINDDRIFYKEALSLVNNGYNVSYLLLTDKNGGVKEMDGNEVNTKKESSFSYHGIKIITINPPVNFDAFLKKLFLGSFQQTIVKTIIKENADIYHAHEPISLRYAIKASSFTKKKVIFDSHESWIGGTIKDRIIKMKYLNKIRYLITVNEGILSNFLKRTTLKHAEVIYNCSHPLFFHSPIDPPAVNDPIRLVHEGSLTFDRGLKTMMHCLLLLRKRYPFIKLKIIGGCPSKERKYISKFIAAHDLTDNFEITGWLPYKNISKNLTDCDIGLIMYRPTKNNLYSTSNKLFNYIASGLAIVSVDIPETTRILSTINNNIIVKNHNVLEMAEAIATMIQHPEDLLQKKMASQEAYTKYNWNNEEKKLLQFYHKVIED